MIRPEPQLTETFSIALRVEQVDTCFPEPLVLAFVLVSCLQKEVDLGRGWITWSMGHRCSVLWKTNLIQLKDLLIVYYFMCMYECCMNLCVSREYRRLRRPEKGFRYSGNWLLAAIQVIGTEPRSSVGAANAVTAKRALQSWEIHFKWT